MDFKHFTKTMMYLQAMYNHPVEELVQQIYWQRLKDCQQGAFDAAVKNIIDTFHPTSACPFPVPAHFVEIIDKHTAKYCTPPVDTGRGHGMYEIYKPAQIGYDELGTPEERVAMAKEMTRYVKELCQRKSMPK